ncbi:MAG: rhodanese-like domain-containing protein [Flavobacteriaceae bacterium]|nr:rhodanese-like domain-containing protein [Flavobacteriaceae bacterium]
MFGKLISSLFKKSVDFKQLVQEGALVLDVRTPQEYKAGHIKGSKNIPLQNIKNQLKNLPEDKVIITCCKSGMRSANAKAILSKEGYTVYNGGGWMSLRDKL